MNVVIISGGRFPWKSVPDFLGKLLQNSAVVVAVDGGLSYCEQLGIVPDHIVGDFDTVGKNKVDKYRNQSGILIHEYPANKDMTDTKAAIELSIELIESRKEKGRIYLLGATGNRQDHMLANIGCLRYATRRGVDMVMMDDKNCIRCYQKSFTIQKKDLYDTKYVSLLALEPVKNLNIKGMKYEAGGMDLDILSDIGVSNEITEDTAAVSFDKGCLLLIASKD